MEKTIYVVVKTYPNGYGGTVDVPEGYFCTWEEADAFCTEMNTENNEYKTDFVYYDVNYLGKDY